MGRRRFEMFQYRSVLAQIRRGASDRELARSHAMGRRKLGEFRALAAVQGWLDAEAPLPDEAQIAAALEPAKQAARTVFAPSAHPGVAGAVGARHRDRRPRSSATTATRAATRRCTG
nr:hypothetical protein [Azohydromonas caseinilytica]